MDISAIQAQIPYELLPVYVVQKPPLENESLPYRSAPEFDHYNGPHLGYAIQWFAFALMSGIGYVRYVRVSSDQYIQ